MVYFFVTVIIFGELTSSTLKERMTTDIIFEGATPIKYNESSYASVRRNLWACAVYKLHCAVCEFIKCATIYKIPGVRCM